jgi:CheY-like chemotaxis protein
MQNTSPAPARILIAEDDPDVLGMLDLALCNAGEQLVVAANGQEALQRAAERCADLLVADVNLGDITGIELADRLRERNPWLRVVLISGEQFTVPVSLADAQILAKPFAMAQLRQAVNTALHY